MNNRFRVIFSFSQFWKFENNPHGHYWKFAFKHNQLWFMSYFCFHCRTEMSKGLSWKVDKSFKIIVKSWEELKLYQQDFWKIIKQSLPKFKDYQKDCLFRRASKKGFLYLVFVVITKLSNLINLMPILITTVLTLCSYSERMKSYVLLFLYTYKEVLCFILLPL